MNEIKLTARMGKEPVIKDLGTKSVARFSVAVETLNKHTKTSVTAWMNCEMWKQKEDVIEFEKLKKGVLLDLVGYFKSVEWDDAATSEKKSKCIIVVSQASITQRIEKDK